MSDPFAEEDAGSKSAEGTEEDTQAETQLENVDEGLNGPGETAAQPLTL